MRLLRLSLLSLALASPALAQSDEPLPYDDGTAAPDSNAGPENTPQPYSDPTPHAHQETAVEQEDRDVSLARFDDPAKGFGGELIGGVLMLDSSRGAGTDKHAGFGVRLTWDFGRLMANDLLHEGLFADFNWLHASAKDGTTAVFDDTSFNYLTVAPAFELPFGHGSAFGVYAQLGVGLALESTTLNVCGADCSNPGQTPVSGIKPLFQYGLGLRGRPLVSQDGMMRLEFRLELTRFRRSYMNDTYLGASVGLAY